MPENLTPSFNLIVILGPTASGKTRLAAQLAYQLQTEIISADSRQVYRDMNIGTGKDYEDYVVNGIAVPYHLIDIADAGSNYHIHQFMKDFERIFRQIYSSGKIPVLCGGSGLYIDAILNGYQFTAIPVNNTLREQLEKKSRDELKVIFDGMPENAYTSLADVSTAKRLIRAIEISKYLAANDFKPSETAQIRPLVFGLNPDRENRRENIRMRLEKRLSEGLIEEVRSLMLHVPAAQLIRYGLEYKFVVMHLTGEISFEQLKEQLTIAIQQFAKRQMTYFRKMERDGLKITWLPGGLSPDDQQRFILSVINCSSFS
ncbi:tRNA (adenosine(37)-N6)-dimethylallyltransferase MiaA [Pedobacter sp. HMF7647]|uniref:tRNA dimethylallyltransferase n=1 Tax=Hufsiella arboris TaxID=2695275 RepID=A0A7K1YEP1_9SPHI|nr:tRNA (adenosine(37)-N6)-dimethylallyltransferase MiaA [Hufsiella arboris]MXV52870.1 tRNA (adenosine(37)-N6)-dimethylallyltransferase MiaA [Hufsiella arboris]